MIEDLTLELECKYCGYTDKVYVDEPDYNAWHNGEPIQDCFPHLTAGERELMLSGTCDTCWKKFFPYANEEEEEE